MKLGASKTGVLLLSIAGAAAVFALYLKLKPRPTVDALVQSVRQDPSYEGVKHILQSNDAKLRLKAVEALLKVQTDEAFRLLEGATRDRSTVVRVAIAEALQDMPEHRALPLILKLIDDKEFGIVRDSIGTFESITGKQYNYRFESSNEEKTAIIMECKTDIHERLKRQVGKN